MGVLKCIRQDPAWRDRLCQKDKQLEYGTKNISREQLQSVLGAERTGGDGVSIKLNLFQETERNLHSIQFYSFYLFDLLLPN